MLFRSGRLLARGTVAEIIATSGLVTWHVHARDPVALAARLRGLPGVAMVAPFGTELHVSGHDADALQRALSPFLADPALRWEREEPSLEDAFISLMERNRAPKEAA